MEEIWKALQAAFEAAALTAGNLNAGGVTILVIWNLEEETVVVIKDLNCPDGRFRMARRQTLEPDLREGAMLLDWNVVVQSDNGFEKPEIDAYITQEVREALYGKLIGLE